MRCLATSVGSAGDFLPTLALASALHRRGHEVTFVSNPFYEPQIRRAGLTFLPAGPFLNLSEQVETRPHLVDPVKGGLILFDEFAGPNAELIYTAFRDELTRSPYDVIIANDISFSAFWAAAERRVPSALVSATPLMWMNPRAPVVASDWEPPRFMQGALTRVTRTSLGWLLGRRMRVIARRIGATVGDPSFWGTLALVSKRLGLWSPALRDSLEGDPPNGVICGSARASAFGAASAGLPPEVESFLQAGPPPVVVGLGSIYALVAQDVLSAIAEACGKLERRCLIVGHPAAATFPAGTLAVRYAPYDQLFPRAAVSLVHGGAGGTSEALRSGRPAIAVPFAYDQFWMAAQIERLGVGIRVRRSRRTAADFAEALARILADETMARRAVEVGRAFSAERDGAEVAADVVQKLAGDADRLRSRPA
jgi:UDP:flavonoid glycosyltransferase YjiC (YdhE family)